MSVVINVLSAAGSRIVPRTVCMLNRRAKYPSALKIPSELFQITPEIQRQTRSVRPAYTKRVVASVKSFCRIDHPRTGHATIRDTVNTFGNVYMFSRRVGLVSGGCGAPAEPSVAYFRGRSRLAGGRRILEVDSRFHSKLQ